MNGNEWWKNPALAPFFQQPASQDVTQQEVIGGGNGKTGYTGRGPDGVVQADRRVPGAGNGQYDAHEEEFVLNANVTQAIGPDVLQGLQKGAEEGTLDVNKLREVIGQPAKQSFQKGGMAPATVQQPAQAQTTIPTQPRQAQPSPTPAPESKKPRPPLFGMGKPRPPKEVGATGIMTPDTIPSPDLAKTVPDLNLMTGIDQIEGATAKFPGKPGPQATPPAKPLPPAGALGEGGTFPTKPIAEIPTGQYSEEGVKPPSKAIQAPKVKAFGEGGIFPAEDIPNAVSDIPQLLPETVDQLNQNGISMDDVLKYMQGIMDGSNPYFQMIKDLLMQDIGGAGAAGTAAMKQEARQRGWSEGQIASLGVSRQRDVEAIGSQALGKLATEQAKMGLQAAKDVFNMQMQKEHFDFAKQKYGDTEGQRIAADIMAGMSWEQIKEKYPNMTKEDFDRMAAGYNQQLQIAADQDLAAHFMNNYTTPGYDWKTDPEALQKLSKAWAATGSDEPFDINNPEHLAWAQQRFDVSTQSPGQILMGQLHNTPTYKDAPVGGTNPDGSSIYEITNPDGSVTHTKEFYDEKLLPYLSKLADFGTQISFKLDDNGNLIAIDNASGDVINTGDQDITDVIGGGNYKNPDGTYNLGQAVTDFNDKYTGTDVTDDAMKQWLENHNGQLPSEDQWKEWSLTDRVYDFDNDDDVTAALDIFDDEFMLDGVTNNAMKQFLQDHNGKLPKNEREWERWSESDRVFETEGEDLTAAYNQMMSGGGSDVSRSRVQQYLEENNGKLPSVDGWNEWNDKTGNMGDIKDFLNGEGNPLREVDKKLLSDIRKAQEAVARGDATDEQKKLAERMSKINSVGEQNFESLTDSGYWGTGMGKTHTKITGDSNLYEVGKTGHHQKFNDATREKFEQMGGQTIFYDGKYYKINAEKPITDYHMFYKKKLTSGNDTYTMKFYSDALNVVDLETGEEIQLTFGSKGKYWD